MSVQLLTEHLLEDLSLKGGCRGLSKSTLVKMPHCWKSYVTAQLCFNCGIFSIMVILYIDRASEGKTVQIEYRGDVEITVQDILGGVRSTCTYVGAGKLKELSRRTTFIRVTQQLNEVFSAFTKEH